MKQAIAKLLAQPKNRKIAVALALVGSVTPVAGLHKFYLGQPVWGVVYLLLWSTPIPQFACAIEAVWYLLQDVEGFRSRFAADGSGKLDAVAESQKVGVIATALRELEKLRTDGLITEYEFEQKRRHLLDRVG
jgi:TM2 domain-containing membrane protein YozV